MDKKSVNLLLVEEDGAKPGTRQTVMNAYFNPSEQLQVYDARSRVMVLVRASEISLYRHSVHLDGKMYKILNIYSPFHLRSAA